MLVKTVEFGKESTLWSTERSCNIAFLKSMEMYMNDLIRCRGYIYLNQIYEMLEIKWNPKDENPCIENDHLGRKVFAYFNTYFKEDETVLVTIIGRFIED